MTEKASKKVKTVSTTSPTVEVPTNQQPKRVDKLITLRGTTTSQVRKREKLSNTPAYCFLKTEEQEKDIPVIFRINEEKLCPHHKKYFSDLQKEINCCPWYCHGKLGNWLKPHIKKGSYLSVQGHYSNSDKQRPSFTAYSYQLLEPNLQSKLTLLQATQELPYLEQALANIQQVRKYLQSHE